MSYDVQMKTGTAPCGLIHAGPSFQHTWIRGKQIELETLRIHLLLQSEGSCIGDVLAFFSSDNQFAQYIPCLLCVTMNQLVLDPSGTLRG